VLDHILYTLLNMSNKISYLYVNIHVHNTIENSRNLSIYDCYYQESSTKAMNSIDVIQFSIKDFKIGIHSPKMTLSCRNMSELSDYNDIYLYIINEFSWYIGSKRRSK
jgi:hypothetical protein